MALVEKQIVFKRKAENGDTEMHFPVTRAEYVEGSVLTVNGGSPDSTGDVTVDDYVTDITISGKTVTITKKDGTSTTQTTQDTTYTLPTATASVLGGVTIGDNITVSSGKISLSKSNVTTALGYTPLQAADKVFNDVSVDNTNLKFDTTSGGSTSINLGAWFLPLDGSSIMSGTIKFSTTQALAKTTTSGGLGLYGGTSPLDGAQLVLYGKDSTEAGKFAIAANDGDTKVYLYGYADGTLTWGGSNVVRSVNGIVADASGNVPLTVGNLSSSAYSANSYCKLSNGLQLVYGSYSSSEDTTKTITFARAFKSAPKVLMTCQANSDSYLNGSEGILSVSATQVKIYNGAAVAYVHWIAIGEGS